MQKIEDLPDEKNRNRMMSIRQKFKLIDADGNGTLDIDEFHQLAGNLNMTREQLHADFGQLDDDGSGQVSMKSIMFSIKSAVSGLFWTEFGRIVDCTIG